MLFKTQRAHIECSYKFAKAKKSSIKLRLSTPLVDSCARDVTPSAVEGNVTLSEAEGTVTGVTPVTHFFPGFCFSGYNTERYVIQSPPEGLDLDILTLKQQRPELSLGEIAKELKTHKMKVKRVLEKYQIKTEILKSKSENFPPPRLLNTAESLNATLQVDRKPATEATSFSNPRLQPGGPETGKSSPYPLPLPTAIPQGGMPNVEPGNDTKPAALSSNPFRGDVEKLSQSSEREVNIVSSPCPLPLPTAIPQGGMPNVEPGNDTKPAALNSNPFTGDVELSNQPSELGVNALTLNPEPKTQNKELSFSQRVKKQIAQKNMERMKNR